VTHRDAPPRHRAPRSRPPTRSLALRLLLAIVLGTAGLIVTGAPSEAVTVPDSQCARYDHGIRTGLCLRDGHGALYWLGTFRGYDGAEVYCIDYLFATDWGVGHARKTYTGGLPTSIGGSVGAATAAALTYVVTRHPANTADDTTAAAIGLLIREVMGDVRTGHGRTIPGGLTAAAGVMDVGFVAGGALARARSLWNEARTHRGPWRLQIVLDPGRDSHITVGERLTATVRGRSGSGAAQGMTVALSYRGFRGPASVALGSDGIAKVSVIAPAVPGSGSVAGRVGNAPSAAPVVIRPNDWKTNPRPGHSSPVTQRGLLGRQEVVTASASASAVIVKVRPSLVTQVSRQQVEPGASIQDAVVLSGTHGAAGAFTWTLLGPVPAASRSCPAPGDVAWTAAGVLASGVVSTHGDGRSTTPPYRVRPEDVGCLTYVEAMAGTATTLPVTTPAGVGSETVLVQHPAMMPCLHTVTSRQVARVGSSIRDRIVVGCLAATDRIAIAWTAHGPVAPRPGVDGKPGCNRIGLRLWSRAPVAARGSVTVTGPVTVLTGPVSLTRPGCYTYSESAAPSTTTTAARTEPGLAVETSIVTRPAVPVVPEVPTGSFRAPWSAWQDRDATSPDRMRPVGRIAPRYADRAYVRPETSPGPPAGILRVGGLRIAAPVESVVLRDSVMAIPDAGTKLGWLRDSARAGDVIGSSVIAGHVSDSRDRPGALRALDRVRAGTRISWTDGQGRVHRFVVTSVARYPRTRGLPAAVFRTDGPHLLRVITCTHRIGLPGGGFHYTDNLVVTARAVS
jgi:hypothetical protein